MKLRPLMFLMLGMAMALLVAILIVQIGLNPPKQDLQLLGLFMALTGFSSVLLAYWLYERGWISQFSSLRWTLMISLVITILLVLLNVWITAQLMFISQHDFVLTSALLAFAGSIAFIFGLFVANRLTARIEALSQAAERVAQGNFETHLTVQGKDELAELAQTFNLMASNLHALDEQKQRIEQTRRDLIAGVSHDLRTPLTAIRAMLEAVQDGIASDPSTMQRYLANSLSEINHLNHLIDDLLELALLDSGKFDLEFVDASLKDLILECLNRIKATAEQRHLQLRHEIEAGIDIVQMAPDKIQRVILNLLDNAVRYTPAQGIITVRAFRQGSALYVTVHNTGANINPIHLPHLFSTFYRVQPAHTREEDGHRSMGLGLAIARRFMEAHKGSIKVQSSPQAGTLFTLQFSISITP